MYKTKNLTLLATLLAFFLTPVLFAQQASSEGSRTAAGNPVSVSLPSFNASPGTTVAVPVTVGDLTGRNAISFDFEVRFDPAVLRPVAAAPTSNAGTLSSSFVITANPNLSGRLLVSGFNAYPLSGQGTLLNLNFEVVGQSGATPLTWQSFMFNEGNPASTAAAGQFTVAAARALKSAYDFDGDGRTDLGVFRPTDRFWYMFRTSAGFAASPFGLSTDRIVPADYDGDGKTDLGIFRDGQWFWLNSSTGTYSFVTFGLAGDTPVPADYTGDGKADPAIFRGGVWYILNAASGQSSIVSFGLATDKPVVGDFDNDGKADQAVFRNGQWLINRSCLGPTTAQFGQTNDRPVAGDFDGDGKADLGVFRNGVWYLMRSTQGLFALQFGIATDTPIAADYDGDGKTDIAVFRNGVWYQFRSLKGFASIQFGVSTDKPVPAAYQQ
ncbi:MAG: hypothetical protein JSS81_05590 [Acidobacteria bacterium]|nr:hypothetical protein [Acidobacteriota bacterium]